MLAALVIVGALAFLHAGTPAPAYANQFSAAPLGSILLRVLPVTVLPLWLFLRAIDLAIGGPARRRGQIRARVIR